MRRAHERRLSLKLAENSLSVSKNFFEGRFMEEKADALVLRSVDYKDNDKLLTLFTLQYGKITASAKGVKKAGARLKFAAQPFCFAEYVFAKKGDRRTVISAANTDGFYALREDIEKFYAASAVCEVCDTLLFEGIVNEELFLSAVNALKNMCERDAAEELIRFLIGALRMSGYMLSLAACAECGAILSGRVYFDISEGCFYCGDCAKGAGTGENTYNLLRKCSNLSYRGDKIDAAAAVRVLKLLKVYFHDKTDCNLKSLGEYIHLLGIDV